MKSVKILMLLVAFVLLPGCAQAREVEKIGVQDLQRILEASKGRVLIVAFWATWCAPCVQEFPTLMALRAQHPEDALNLIGISVDSSIRPVENFIKQRKANFPVYLDNGEISNMLAIRSIPRIMIFSRSGEKVLDHLGYIPEDSLRHVVDKVRSMP